MIKPQFPLAVLAFAALAFLLGQAVANADRIRLAGYGCEGAGGTLYAMNESDFPPCARIEAR